MNNYILTNGNLQIKLFVVGRINVNAFDLVIGQPIIKYVKRLLLNVGRLLLLI